MENLVELMRKVLANSFMLYVKAQNYHWNVEGKDFPQYHNFFGCLYGEIYGSIDKTAEQIRALGEYSPGTLRRFVELSDIQEEVAIPNIETMLVNLFRDNNVVLESLNQAFKQANAFDQQGLVNYLGERIEAHKKHAWMLRACIKNDQD